MSTEPLPPITPSTRSYIAANVRRLRVAKGLTQEELADLAEFHRTYVSMLERRRANISIDGLDRIARILDVLTIELLQPTVEDAASATSSEAEAEADACGTPPSDDYVP